MGSNPATPTRSSRCLCRSEAPAGAVRGQNGPVVTAVVTGTARAVPVVTGTCRICLHGSALRADERGHGVGGLGVHRGVHMAVALRELCLAVRAERCDGVRIERDRAAAARGLGGSPAQPGVADRVVVGLDERAVDGESTAREVDLPVVEIMSIPAAGGPKRAEVRGAWEPSPTTAGLVALHSPALHGKRVGGSLRVLLVPGPTRTCGGTPRQPGWARQAHRPTAPSSDTCAGLSRRSGQHVLMPDLRRKSMQNGIRVRRPERICRPGIDREWCWE